MERLGINPADLITRHVTGDWGDIDPEDRGLNGPRSMTAPGSSRCTARPRTRWLITEAESDPDDGCRSATSGHRAATTILRPEDY